MTAEISPQPTPEEREAILHALAALNGSRNEPSAWWEAGVQEAVEDDRED